MLKKVIEQLSESQFQGLHKELVTNRGEKFVRLLELFRQPGLDEDQVKEKQDTTGAAFYTLKSRLQDKVQEYLFRQAADDRAELLKNISAVPMLVYNTPRETAISMLEFLETQLRVLDMPAELVSVYSALKKLHLNSERFYHFQQMYNKNVAYSLAIDKAEELVALFTRELGYFLFSQDTNRLDILRLYLKELNNLNKLYDSHRLKACRIIAHLSYQLFTKEDDATEETTEELLKQLREILDAHPDDRRYRFLDNVWHFFNFEYYHLLGLHKNGKASFEKLLSNSSDLFSLNHTFPVSVFLLSKCERAMGSGEKQLPYNPDPEDLFSVVNYGLYRSALEFSEKKYVAAANILNTLVNEVSFKNFLFAECQVKLLLSLNLLLAGKSEQAEVSIRSITRKLSSDGQGDNLPAAMAFARFVKTALTDNSPQKDKKLRQLFSTFTQLNSGRGSFLKFIRLEEEHFKILSR